MSKVIETFNSEASLNKSISFKVNEDTHTLLHKVFLHRLNNGLSNDFSHFLRQSLMVALLCDDPENYMPQFEIPNIENLLNELENQKQDNTELIEVQENEIETEQ